MIPDAAVEEFTKDCPKCGLTISAPTFLAHEKPVYDPVMESFRVRVHVGPNDVEYETHVTACAEEAK